MTVVERNCIRISGQGQQPMLFAHGFGCDQSMWRYIIPAFEANYRTIAFDHVGSGRSEIGAYEENKYSTLHGYAADILEICQELDLRDVILVAHSVSSMMGALAATREPNRFAALIMITPSPSFIDEGDYSGGFSRADIDEMLHFIESNFIGWSKTMAKVIMGRPDHPELGEELEQLFCQSNPYAAKKFARVTFLSDHRADLPRIPTPTLVLQCCPDAIVPPSVGEYIQASIPGSKLVVLQAEGHCPNLSSPNEVISEIRRFLDSASS